MSSDCSRSFRSVDTAFPIANVVTSVYRSARMTEVAPREFTSGAVANLRRRLTLANGTSEATTGPGIYEALIAYDDAPLNVATLTRMTADAHRQLTDAIRGDGDFEEAKARFRSKSALLADAHAQWSGVAAALNATVADVEQCAQCGAA